MTTTSFLSFFLCLHRARRFKTSSAACALKTLDFSLKFKQVARAPAVLGFAS